MVLRNAASGGVTQPGKFNSCSVAVAGRKRRARCAERGQPVEAVGIVAHFWDCLRCAVGTQDQPNTLCGALTRLVHIQAQIVRAAHDALSVRQTHEQGWPRGRPQRSENSVLHTPPRCHARAAHERKRRRCATRGHARVPISPASSAGFTRRRRMRASSASFHGGIRCIRSGRSPGARACTASVVSSIGIRAACTLSIQRCTSTTDGVQRNLPTLHELVRSC